MISHIAKTLQDIIIWIAWLPWVIFLGQVAMVWMIACIPAALFTMLLSKRENSLGYAALVLLSGVVLPVIGLLAILLHWLLGKLV